MSEHVPLMHDWPDAHARPHMPQLALSVWSDRHVPEQFDCPDGHVVVHTPLTHA
jgi:hypothetical protein